MTLAPGATLGPYTIRAELGHGGMGVVYTAQDPRLDRQVAIKTGVSRRVDNAHPPAAKLRDDPIRAEGRAWGQGHGRRGQSYRWLVARAPRTLVEPLSPSAVPTYAAAIPVSGVVALAKVIKTLGNSDLACRQGPISSILLTRRWGTRRASTPDSPAP